MKKRGAGREGGPPGEGATLARVLLHMEATWPEEGCGALFISEEGEWVWQAMENAARHPREAFEFGQSWLGLLREREERGLKLACLVHSHPGGGLSLSRADLERLAPQGRLLWPGIMQMVVVTGPKGWESLAWYKPEGAGFKCVGRRRRCFGARKEEAFEL